MKNKATTKSYFMLHIRGYGFYAGDTEQEALAQVKQRLSQDATTPIRLTEHRRTQDAMGTNTDQTYIQDVPLTPILPRPTSLIPQSTWDNMSLADKVENLRRYGKW